VNTVKQDFVKLTLGMFASLAAALVALPVLLRWFGGKPTPAMHELRVEEATAHRPAS